MADGELPEGWATATLPELVGNHGLFVDGDWVESKDQDPDGDVRLVQLADVGDGEYLNMSHRFMTTERAVALGCTFLREGDLLIARMPDPLGRACLFPGDAKRAVTVVDICVVRGDEAKFNRRWLMHFVNAPAFRVAVHGLQSGSTRKRISKGNLATLSLPIPPKAEQSRIAGRLDEVLTELDAGVAELHAAQKKLAQYRQSLLKAAVEGALTQDWRAQHPPRETGAALLTRILKERRARWEARQLDKFKAQGKLLPKGWQDKYPEPVKPDFDSLPSLPNGWVWSSLDQLAWMVRNGLSQKPSEDSGGMRILRISAVRPLAVNLADVRYLAAEAEEFDDYLLADGDLLATRYNGTVELLGVVAVVRGLTQPTVHPDKLIRIRLALDSVLGDWVEICAATGASRSHIAGRARTTAGQTGISGDDMKKMPIPLPPIPEQAEIVELVTVQLNEGKGLRIALESSMKQAAAQRQNILRAAFSGQLVPQDPRDEPAAALLARIRAERAGQGAKPRKARAAKETS